MSHDPEILGFQGAGVRVLYQGVDWLQVSTTNMLCSHIIAQLAPILQEAKLKGEAQDVELEGEILDPLSGEVMQVALPFRVWPKSIGMGFSCTFASHQVEIHTRFQRTPLDSMPNLMMRLSNEFMHSEGWLNAYIKADYFLRSLLEDGAGAQLKISRVDLFADLQGLPVGSINHEGWVGQPQARKTVHSVGRRRTGVSFDPDGGDTFDWRNGMMLPGYMARGLSVGKSGKIRFRLYDKTEEILKNSMKTWFYDCWARSENFTYHLDDDGLPYPAEPVTRVEFQIRGERLTTFRGPGVPRGIYTVGDLVEGAGGLWRYLCGEKTQTLGRKGWQSRRGWISLRVPPIEGHDEFGTPIFSDVNRSRWELDPRWEYIRDLARDVDPLHRVPTIALREAKALKPTALGLIRAVALRYAIDADGDPKDVLERMLKDESGQLRAEIKETADEKLDELLDDIEQLIELEE